MGPMPNNAILPPVPCLVGPTKAGMTKARMTKPMKCFNVSMMQVNIFNYTIFSNSIKILLNYVPNDFLQQWYTLYGVAPPPFAHPITPGDSSTPHVDMHDLIFFVLQASPSSHAASMQWSGSATAGAPPTWPPLPLPGFWLPSGLGY
jgi:hypothetical protein